MIHAKDLSEDEIDVAAIRSFFLRVEINTPDKCWEWTGTLQNDYPYLVLGRNRRMRAHRFSYFIFKNYLRPDYVIDHLCKNTKCVNPYHLRLVTAGENVKCGDGAVITFSSKCVNGHSYVGTGFLKYRKSRHGGRTRICKECARIKSRLNYKQNTEYVKQLSRDYYHQNKEACLKKSKERYLKLKAQVAEKK